MNRPAELLLFLGPSLASDEAKRLAPSCLILPPARQGDVIRALVHRPRVICLVDGVFEAQPSVWHRELIAALDAGVELLGASSMGALRAAELDGEGMVGVGTVYEWLKRGLIEDDAEVALLHGSAEDHYRALTVPLVNVRYAAAKAAQARILSRGDARGLVERASAIFYQERTWPRVLEGLPPSHLEQWKVWARRGLPDVKREDARACVREGARRRRARRSAGSARSTLASSWLRRARWLEGQSASESGALVSNRQVVERLESAAESEELQANGLRRKLLASWARERGLRPGARHVLGLLESWKEHLGAAGEPDSAFFARLGMDSGEARSLLDEVALEAQVLGLAMRWIPDGPTTREGLMAQSRLEGLWLEAVQRLVKPGPPRLRKPGKS